MAEIAVIGVPLDLGANRRGVDMGPSALRLTRLVPRLRQLGHAVIDTGDLDVPLPEEVEIGDERLKYAENIRDVCEELCDRVKRAMEAGRLPLILGGDHSIGMGSTAGSASHFRAQERKLGLIWVDAHGDMNTPETSPSGNVHGMPLAHALGLGDPSLAGIGGFAPKVDPKNTVIFGARDLDERERRVMMGAGVRVITMKQIDQFGVGRATEEAIQAARDGTAGIHVSFDVDSLDPTVAPGVGTPKKGGLSYREAHLFMELVADSRALAALDMVEINPILDNRNQTAELAAELILSAMGKSIF
jgi:arginase